MGKAWHSDHPRLAVVTQRQLVLLQLVAHYGDQRVVARALGISRETVRNRLNAVRRAFGVNTTYRAVLAAWLLGWIE